MTIPIASRDIIESETRVESHEMLMHSHVLFQNTQVMDIKSRYLNQAHISPGTIEILI